MPSALEMDRAFSTAHAAHGQASSDLAADQHLKC